MFSSITLLKGEDFLVLEIDSISKLEEWDLSIDYVIISQRSILFMSLGT